MRELILIFSYIVCAFAPVLLIPRIRRGFSFGQFWGIWFVSLTGAFGGGVLGTIFLARTEMEFGFFASIIPAFVGAWALGFLFLTIREQPENW